MLDIIILAAGAGTRMRSKTRKIMHKVAGKPLLARVLDTAKKLHPQQIHTVISPDSADIKNYFCNHDINWVVQDKQLGTAHAVLQVLPHLNPDNNVLIVFADAPLLRPETLAPLTAELCKTDLALLIANLAEPFGLGRIIRDHDNNVAAIVEERDANSEQKKITEIYTGICCVKAKLLIDLLPKISNNNAQQEFYLTDLIALAVQQNATVSAVCTTNNDDILGVNTREQLANIERIQQQRLASSLLAAGVTIADPKRIDIRGNLECAKDVFIDSNNVFCGEVFIDEDSVIEPNCLLTNVKIGKNTTIKANSVLEDCVIADNCQIGPFARIRPGTAISNDCKIGNFVEIKNTQMGYASKASHLSYLGDAVIGKQVNIGAGTITCNYDGANKHITTIEDGVFIGSDTQIVAPLTIGAEATIGAGSTLRRNVPAQELTLTTSTQKTIYGWKRPVKKKSDETI